MSDPLRDLTRFLFDLDGTLVDSSGAHSAAFTTVLATVPGDSVRPFRYGPVKGFTTREVFAWAGIDRADPRLPDLVDRKQRAYLDLVDAGAVVPFTGADALLAWLAGEGLPCGLVTGASRRSTLRLLAAAGLDGRFEAIVTGDDVRNGKPDPEGYLRAVSLLGGEAADYLVVEDAVSGARAAHAAGLRVAGVHDPEVAPEADLYCESLPDLLERLRFARTSP
jgi:HAD superfamily hydrolase (TIGR01509 family)